MINIILYRLQIFILYFGVLWKYFCKKKMKKSLNLYYHLLLFLLLPLESEGGGADVGRKTACPELFKWSYNLFLLGKLFLKQSSICQNLCVSRLTFTADSTCTEHTWDHLWRQHLMFLFHLFHDFSSVWISSCLYLVFHS